MPFDGVQYGRMPLIRNGAYYPDSRAAGDVARRSLAAAYMYARSGCNILAQIAYGTHPAQPSTRLTNKSTTTDAIIANPRVYLPKAATHVYATVSYAVADAEHTEVQAQIRVLSEQIGSVFAQKHETISSLEAVANVEGEARAAAINRGVVTCWVKRTTPTAASREVRVYFGARDVEGTTIVTRPARPQVVTIYWRAIG